jgi:hypothetical protein
MSNILLRSAFFLPLFFSMLSSLISTWIRKKVKTVKMPESYHVNLWHNGAYDSFHPVHPLGQPYKFVRKTKHKSKINPNVWIVIVTPYMPNSSWLIFWLVRLLETGRELPGRFPDWGRTCRDPSLVLSALHALKSAVHAKGLMLVILKLPHQCCHSRDP